MSTINHFLQEKRENFCKFLLDVFPGNQKIKEDIDKYMYIGIPEFCIYVKQNITPYKNEIDLFVKNNFNKYCDKYKIEDVKNEDLNKIKRYLLLFIDICSRI